MQPMSHRAFTGRCLANYFGIRVTRKPVLAVNPYVPQDNTGARKFHDWTTRILVATSSEVRSLIQPVRPIMSTNNKNTNYQDMKKILPITRLYVALLLLSIATPQPGRA